MVVEWTSSTAVAAASGSQLAVPSLLAGSAPLLGVAAPAGWLRALVGGQHLTGQLVAARKRRCAPTTLKVVPHVTGFEC
jgi:hypothetical protein